MNAPTHMLQPAEGDSRVALLGTVSTDASVLFFAAVQKGAATPKRLSCTISGVSAGAVTKLTTPASFHFEDALGRTATEVSVAGNGLFVIFVQFEAGPNVGSFSGDLRITGAETGTQIVKLSAVVAPNPSIFPSSLAFNAVEGLPSVVQELTLTVSNVSAAATTIVEAPDFYQILLTPIGKTAKIITFTGSGVFKLFARFSGGDVGRFDASIVVRGTEVETKTVPLRTTVFPIPTPVANPASLSGFAATEGGAASATQSFDVSVKGLPTQGNPVVTVTAPKGYSVALAATSSFVGALVLPASSGSVSRKMFVRLNGNNPVGDVSGSILITGDLIRTLDVPVSGQIKPKPLPILTVAPASLNPFSTLTSKPSIAQSYLLEAANLPFNATATVKPPAGYEVSRTNAANSIFSSQLTIAPIDGAIKATVFVRLKSQTTAGSFAGAVVNSVAGLTRNVSVSGTVLRRPIITVSPTSLTGFAAVKSQASAPKPYALSARNLAAGATAAVQAPANYELRIQGIGSFADSVSVAQTTAASIDRVIEVRIKATAATGAVTGVIRHSIFGVTRNLSVSGVVA